MWQRLSKRMGNSSASLVMSSPAVVKKANESGKKNILVTGGAGYIGTHTVIELYKAGFRVTVLDNMDNASPVALERVRKITGCNEEDILFAEADLMDLARCEEIFKTMGPFDGAIHFAGLKAVGESVSMPLLYYANNITGTLNLIHLLEKYKCTKVAFSSSATVYGDPEKVPIDESHPLRSTNPYGKTKLYIEEIFRDCDKASPGLWNVALLRYFNPIGAHESGLIGEDPMGIPNNLMPYIAKVVVGKLPKVNVFGDDYDTKDGTGCRDYLSVVDLARGHVAAIEKVLVTEKMGARAYNLGTGTSTSVLEMIAAMEKASGRKIPYEIAPRREGDIATCYADASKAKEELGWEATIPIDEAVASSWKWQSENPTGFKTEEEAKKSGEQERKCLVFKMYAK